MANYVLKRLAQSIAAFGIIAVAVLAVAQSQPQSLMFAPEVP